MTREEKVQQFMLKWYRKQVGDETAELPQDNRKEIRLPPGMDFIDKCMTCGVTMISTMPITGVTLPEEHECPSCMQATLEWLQEIRNDQDPG